MVAQGVKGIAITPTSPAVSAALDKAIKAGRQGRPDGQRHPQVEEEDLGRRDEQLQRRHARRQVPRRRSSRRATRSGILEGIPGNPALVDRVTGMLAGLGALKSKIKVVSKLETDCDQTKGATAAQTILTANQSLTAIYSACGPPALGAIQSIKNAGIKPGGIILVGFDASTDEVKAIKAGTETGSVAQFPAKIGSLGIATLCDGRAGQEGAEERRHRHRARHEGEREQVLKTSPAGIRRRGARLRRGGAGSLTLRIEHDS